MPLDATWQQGIGLRLIGSSKNAVLVLVSSPCLLVFIFGSVLVSVWSFRLWFFLVVGLASEDGLGSRQILRALRWRRRANSEARGAE